MSTLPHRSAAAATPVGGLRIATLDNRCARRPPRTAGFALVVSLVLMGFIMLLLISLATMTNVEIQTNSSSQEQAQARQYARTALYIAIGQLQAFAGPDQRTTAAADLAEGNTALAQPQDGTRFWTGVWGNANAPADKLSKPVLLNWLVSGNEEVSATAEDSGSEFGSIIAPTQNAATPFAPDAQLALNAAATALDRIPFGNGTARLLVGPASTGGSLPLYVAAPAAPIYAPASGGAGGQIAGYYAYWVGDEGVKARINLNDHWNDEGNASQKSWSFANAQRTAGESMFANLPTDATVNRIIAAEQIHLADSTVTAVELGERFHDLTLHSKSVLADSKRGGLKRDLTRILEPGGGSSEEQSNRFIFADENGAYSSAGTAFYTKPPTWGLLRDFANFASALHNPLPLQTPTATQQGIHPVLVHVGMSYTYILSAPVGDQQSLSVYVSPLAILWNPYNRPISGGTFEIGVRGPRKGSDGGIVTFRLTGDDPSGGSIDTTAHFNLATSSFETTSGAGGERLPIDPPTSTASEFLRFKATVPELAPGQAIYLGIPNGSTNEIYNPGVTTLVPRTYSLRFNYSNVARVRLDELLVPQAEIGSLEMQLRDLGETTLYLGKENAGADPAAALNATSNDYYQWIGQIGTDSKYIGEADGIFRTPDSDVSGGSGNNPRGMIAIDTVHPFGSFLDTKSVPPLPVRWIEQANPRAYMILRTQFEPDGSSGLAINPVYFSYASHYDTAYYTAADIAPDNRYIQMRSFAGSWEATVANDYTNSSYAADSYRAYPQLFELPEQDSLLFSVANLQHASLSAHVTTPAYTIGNSHANFRIKNLGDTSRASAASGSAEGPLQQELYDHSFLLNEALWDRYFFSTIEKGSDTSAPLPTPLPNSRYSHTRESVPPISELADDAGRQAAANLMLEGGFNVNSTSANAWKAVLGGLNNLAYNPTNPAATQAAPLSNPFSRFRKPLADSDRVAPGVTNARQYWGGYRQLTDEELSGLAERIVGEVRARGPFLSLADFVNRSIDTGRFTGTRERYLLKGALQAAIDDEGELGTEAASRHKKTRINHAGTLTTGSGGGYHSYNMLPSPFGSSSSVNTTDYNLKALAGWNTTDYTLTNNPFSLHGAYNASYLTQADILSAIGASLAARSDTFIIRAYGESVDPVNGSVNARAWCEAVVQRLPEYMKPEHDNASAAPEDLQDINNRQLGRRFKIVSFRWLSPEEI